MGITYFYIVAITFHAIFFPQDAIFFFCFLEVKNPHLESGK